MQTPNSAGMYHRDGVPFSVPLEEAVAAGGAKTPPAKTGNKTIDVALADDELTEDEVALLTDAAKSGDQESADLLDNLGIDWNLVGAAGAAGVAAIAGGMLLGRDRPSAEVIDLGQAYPVQERLPGPAAIETPMLESLMARNKQLANQGTPQVTDTRATRFNQTDQAPAEPKRLRAPTTLESSDPSTRFVARKTEEFDALVRRYEEALAAANGKQTPQVKKLAQLMRAAALRGRGAR